jgi:hypothetical protein
MKFFSLFFALAITAPLFSQRLHCGTDELMHRELQAHPELRALYEQNKNLPETPPASGERAITYIPVVFHVIHNGDAEGSGENISEAQVISQIDALNRDFAGINADAVNIPAEFKSLQAKSEIRFCLAKFDPNGNPSNGITRHNLGQVGWDEPDIESTIKPSTIWDRTRYLNIWSVNFTGTLITDGVLAYARFPFMATSTNDGVVARHNTIGQTGSVLASFRLGRTIVHEVGHYLNLFHIWGDDNGGCNNSDNVSDTPNQADLYFGCPTHPQVSCNSNDMFMNYMDYSDDDCKNMFTIGQNTRMLNALNSSRAALKNSASKCFYNLDASMLEIIHPNGQICSGNILPLIRIKNEGLVSMNSLSFGVSIDNAPQIIQAWTGTILSQDELLIHLDPATLSTGPHSIQVTIITVNGVASDDNSGNNSASASFTVNSLSNPSPVPMMTDFEDGVFPPFNWDASNPNNDAAWAIQTGLSANGLGNGCLVMDNFSSPVNTRGRLDEVISDEYNLSGLGDAQLSFDMAYAARSDSRTDSLKISYSLDCGSSWRVVYQKSGSELATAAFATSAFTPTSAQWRNEQAQISFLAGQPSVKFKFTNVSGWGNKMYLDNINISGTPSSILNLQSPSFQLFPNPSSGSVIVRLEKAGSYSNAQVFDLMGREVHRSAIGADVFALDLSALPAGVYAVKLSSAAHVKTRTIEILR